QADDTGDDAYPAPLIFEVRTLLDMRFDKARVALASEPQARRAGEPGSAQRVAKRQAAVVHDALLHFRRQGANERAAAEAADEARLLVLKRDGIHRERACRLVRSERAHHFERVDHAQRAVEPAAGGLSIGVRT